MALTKLPIRLSGFQEKALLIGIVLGIQVLFGPVLQLDALLAGQQQAIKAVQDVKPTGLDDFCQGTDQISDQVKAKLLEFHPDKLPGGSTPAQKERAEYLSVLLNKFLQILRKGTYSSTQLCLGSVLPLWLCNVPKAAFTQALHLLLVGAIMFTAKKLKLIVSAPAPRAQSQSTKKSQTKLKAAAARQPSHPLRSRKHRDDDANSGTEHSLRARDEPPAADEAEEETAQYDSSELEDVDESPSHNECDTYLRYFRIVVLIVAVSMMASTAVASAPATVSTASLADTPRRDSTLPQPNHPSASHQSTSESSQSRTSGYDPATEPSRASAEPRSSSHPSSQRGVANVNVGGHAPVAVREEKRFDVSRAVAEIRKHSIFGYGRPPCIGPERCTDNLKECWDSGYFTHDVYYYWKKRSSHDCQYIKINVASRLTGFMTQNVLLSGVAAVLMDGKIDPMDVVNIFAAYKIKGHFDEKNEEHQQIQQVVQYLITDGVVGHRHQEDRDPDSDQAAYEDRDL